MSGSDPIDNRFAHFVWAPSAWLLGLCLHEFGTVSRIRGCPAPSVPATGFGVARHCGIILSGLLPFSNGAGRALSQAGFTLASAAGLAPSDILLVCRAMQPW